MSPRLALATFVAGMILALPAAASDLASYVRTEHNLGQGGTPAPIADVASDPLAYLRSEAAWTSLREHVARQIGRDLMDAEFQALLTSSRAGERPCVGTILTAGIDPAGEPRWFLRNCYATERLLTVRTRDGWVVVASLGCWNPVYEPPVYQHEPLPAPIWKVPTHPVEITVPGHQPEPPHKVTEPGTWALLLGGLIGWLIMKGRS